MNNNAAEIPESIILNARNQKMQVNAIIIPVKTAGIRHSLGRENDDFRNTATIPISIVAMENR
jgi:hypothetical protein